MLSSFVLLSTAGNTWLLLLVPTIIMLASLPLWFVRKVSNTILSLISWVAVFGYMAFIFFGCVSNDAVNSPGIMGGIFICLGILLLNAFQFLTYRRMLNHHRCSQCSSLRLKIVGKNVEGYKNTSTTHYINNQTKEKYHKSHTHIHTKTTFLAYCPDCNSLLEWVEEDDDHLHGDTRPEHLR